MKAISTTCASLVLSSKYCMRIACPEFFRVVDELLGITWNAQNFRVCTLSYRQYSAIL